MKKYIYVIIGLISLLGLIIVVSTLSEESRSIAVSEGAVTLDRPRFSRESGFYDEPFYLSIEAADGSTVYYTTDGSIPTKDSQVYESPIFIDCECTIDEAIDYWKASGATSPESNACVIRAIALNLDGEKSAETCETFFIGSGNFSDSYIISIITNPDYLFGDDGIYVDGKEYDDWVAGGCVGNEPVKNFMKRGPESEREIYLDIIDGENSWGQPAGIRIQGASAREDYAKRFSVFSRKEYSGSSTFTNSIFDGVSSHSFVIRPGFMNGFIQHLSQGRAASSADAKEALVFINGHFWYPTMIQEKYNSKFFSEHYGVDGDDVIVVKAGVAESGEEDDQNKYQEIYNFIQTHDISDENAYNEFNRIIDIQSYIDFSVINVYFANLDYNENKNVICWRVDNRDSSPYGDGRWRWALYDLDLENLDYGYLETDIDTFNLDTHYAGAAFNKRALYVALKNNPDFGRQFVVSFMDMINTVFSVENATQIMDDWNVNLDYWRKDSDWCKNYFEARNQKMPEFISNEFNLSGMLCDVNISTDNPDYGIVSLNTITSVFPDGASNSFDGKYFYDYPITLQASPTVGHKFAGWNIDGVFYSKESEIELQLSSENISIEAMFK